MKDENVKQDAMKLISVSVTHLEDVSKRSRHVVS